jgi:acyl carrier protein
MTIRSTVLTQITQVAAEHDKQLVPLTDELPLLESGLDSLCLAVIVARLEEELGVDPFSTGDDGVFPVTIGDLITMYERAAA